MHEICAPRELLLIPIYWLTWHDLLILTLFTHRLLRAHDEVQGEFLLPSTQASSSPSQNATAQKNGIIVPIALKDFRCYVRDSKLHLASCGKIATKKHGHCSAPSASASQLQC
jgi:hypothetical protein